MDWKPRKVTIGLIQTSVAEDPSTNVGKTKRLVEQAAKKGAKIVCLQELFSSRYFPQEENSDAAKFAEPIPGPVVQEMAALAKELAIVLILPLFEKGKDGKFYNSIATIDTDGKILGVYRKIHIPHDPLFYEKSYFSPGNKGYQVYATAYGKVASLICYDQWFPEAARILALKGAEIVFYPTAIGDISGKEAPEGEWKESWELIQRSHAIANGIHIAACNRVGQEDKLKFFGNSFVADAFGKVLQRASTQKEEVLIQEIDLAMNKFIQEAWGFLGNRRPDTYDRLTKQVKQIKNKQ